MPDSRLRGNDKEGAFVGQVGELCLGDFMSGIWDQDKAITALRFATDAHAGQTIPGTDQPYVVHPAQVAMEIAAALVVESAADPDLAMQCALLHDVVEDCSVTVADVQATFGADVAAGVSALSKNPALPKTEAMRDSLDRIRREPHEVWMVKLADRISNLMPPPPHWDKARCAAYAAEARLILDALGEASALLSKRLAAKIAAYARYT
jgi:(p)ppGpp synthase/HD superfamily hydrolase